MMKIYILKKLLDIFITLSNLSWSFVRSTKSTDNEAPVTYEDCVASDNDYPVNSVYLTK